MFRKMLAVVALFLFTTPAMAQIAGNYAFTGSSDCIEVIPPATFDSAFRATAAPVFHTNAYMLGVRKFRMDGTGDANILLGVSTFTAVPPDNATAGSSSASSWTVASQFTYTVDKNQIITMSAVPGSYVQTFTAGGRNGQTLTQDVFDLYGYITPDGNGLSAVSKGAAVETRTFSNGDVRQDVCARAYTGHRMD